MMEYKSKPISATIKIFFESNKNDLLKLFQPCFWFHIWKTKGGAPKSRQIIDWAAGSLDPILASGLIARYESGRDQWMVHQIPVNEIALARNWE